MNNLSKKDFICTGCFLCQDICPTDAIDMFLDDEGFYKYKIDDAKCISCEKCVLACPKLKIPSTHKKTTECYAAYSKDSELVEKSSSGGLFSVFSEYILKHDGVVIGATWQKGKIKHIKVDNKKDLNKLRGSKYLPSDLGGIYKEVKENLLKKRKVLFSGTPCQIAALKNFIIDDENLFIIDVVCHGVPSIKTFRSSVKERFDNENLEANFRYKKPSWEKFSLFYENGKVCDITKDPWFAEFCYNNSILKSDCYDCSFSSLKRSSDITLADFWGISNVNSDFYMNGGRNGTSVVLLNSDKGKLLFDSIKEDIVYKKESIEDAYKYNPRILNGKYDEKYLANRREFFDKFNSGKFTFKEATVITRVFNKIKNTVRRVLKKVNKIILKK